MKETNEFLNGVNVLLDSADKITEDGKINVADAQQLVSLAIQFNTLKDAVFGLGGIKKEIKEMNIEDAKDLGGRIYTTSKKVGKIIGNFSKKEENEQKS